MLGPPSWYDELAFTPGKNETTFLSRLPTPIHVWRLCPLRTPRGRLLSVSYGLKRCYTAPLQPDAVFETKPWVSRKPETPRPRDPDPRPCTLLTSLGLASCRFLSPVELASLDVRACPALTTWRPCGGGDALACPRPALNPWPALMLARCLGPVCSPQLHHSPSPQSPHTRDGDDLVALSCGASVDAWTPHSQRGPSHCLF